MPLEDYTDDDTITNADLLYRRVYYTPAWVTYDVARKRLRPTRAALNNTKRREDGAETYLSVFIKSTLDQMQLQPASVIDSPAALVSISVARFRTKAVEKNVPQQIIRRPLEPPPSGNPAHGGIGGKKTGSIQNELAEHARWVIPLPQEWVADNRKNIHLPEDMDIEENWNELFKDCGCDDHS